MFPIFFVQKIENCSKQNSQIDPRVSKGKKEHRVFVLPKKFLIIPTYAEHEREQVC